MGDLLENFVLRNKESFEEEFADERLWQRIQSKVHKPNPFTQYWKIAAILFLMSTVFLTVDRILQKDDHQEFVAGEISEFEQVELFYNTMIEEKKEQIARFGTVDLKRSFLVEIERLDDLYDELKVTYSEENSSDRVVEAMISNLKLRMEILTQQIKILEKLKQSKNDTEYIQSI